MAAPIFVFSIREGHHWITSLIIAILLIVLLGLIYSLALYDARADSNFFAPENWAIFLAMLSPIIPICISSTNLLLTRLLFARHHHRRSVFVQRVYANPVVRLV